MASEEPRVLDTVAEPDFILEGDGGTLLAVRHYPITPLTSKHCVVVYREIPGADGFVITAYFASAVPSWRVIRWKR